ncbi:MAG: tetratricopeptide repeat protein [bacterium]|nr:tetratricopeptide repeat protein [bacterium]MDT8366808.1 tetratricopeptide repeat protein [bacterium]
MIPVLRLLHWTLLCCLLTLTGAGCVTTSSTRHLTDQSDKPGPAVNEDHAVSSVPTVSREPASEGTILLAGITESLHLNQVVAPQDAVRVVQLLPEDPTSWLAAGIASYRAGDLSNAMERLTRSASLDPGNPITLLALGETAVMTGDLTKADQYFSTAHELSPSTQSANRLALLRIRDGHLESANEILTKALADDPRDIMTRNNLAIALDMMGTTSKGIDILALNEIEDPQLLRTSALLQLKEGHPDRALADLEAGLESIGSAEEWLLRGTADLQQGKLPEAEDKFRSAIVAQPSGYEGYLNLGLTLRRQGKFTEAEKTYQDGLARATHPDLHLNLGVLYELYRGEPALAIEQYRQYIKLEGPASERINGWVEFLEGILETN